MSGLHHYSHKAAAFTAPEPATAAGSLAIVHSVLDDSLNELADVVSALEVRADSVLRPATTPAVGANAEASAPSMANSPAVVKAVTLRLRLDSITERLRDIADRLDT